MRFASGLQTAHYTAGHIGHIRVGPFSEQEFDTFAELVGLILREIRKGVDKYEFGHNGGKREFLFHS